MSDFFKWLEDYCPAILWGAIWICFLPIRFSLLALLPKGSERWSHKLHSLYQFLAFERG